MSEVRDRDLELLFFFVVEVLSVMDVVVATVVSVATLSIK
jgi:hypothetical protein